SKKEKQQQQQQQPSQKQPINLPILKLNINVHPNSKENQIISFENEILSLRISEPPIDGQANKGVVEFLSKELGLRKSNIQVSKGSKSRNKSIEIDLESESITKDELYNKI
ncbi:hypothetical protein DICPUDRAFT_23568, partial [Dictyostelium purpureum]